MSYGGVQKARKRAFGGQPRTKEGVCTLYYKRKSDPVIWNAKDRTGRTKSWESKNPEISHLLLELG